jgi:hypothetical protein
VTPELPCKTSARLASDKPEPGARASLEVVRNLGGEPAGHGDLRQFLLRGRVDLSGLIEERLLIEAMRSNEAETTAIYENAASQPGIPVDVVAVLRQNLIDERRHHAWIVARLEEPGS